MVTTSKTMGAWEFIVAYLVAFVLIQLLVYRYLRGRDDGGGAVLASGHNPDRRARGEPPDRGDRNDRVRRVEAADGARSSGAGERTRRRCPACGTDNEADQAYTFCRNCATRLPA